MVIRLITSDTVSDNPGSLTPDVYQETHDHFDFIGAVNIYLPQTQLQAAGNDRCRPGLGRPPPAAGHERSGLRLLQAGEQLHQALAIAGAFDKGRHVVGLGFKRGRQIITPAWSYPQ